MAFIIAGIDPGITGAIAFYVPELMRASVYDMPVISGEVSTPHLAQLVRQHRPSIAVIEDVHSMPKNSGKSMFTFGRSVGDVRGVFGALEIPLHAVTPQKWKAQFRLINKDKDASRKLAVQLFPSIADDLKLKKHHGRAEAILIAVFGADKVFLKPNHHQAA